MNVIRGSKWHAINLGVGLMKITHIATNVWCLFTFMKTFGFDSKKNLELSWFQFHTYF